MRKMKDSGIEWIGEIPEGWEVVKVGRLFNITAGGDAKLEYYSEVQDETHPFPVYTNSLSRNKVYAYTSQPVFSEKTITVTGRGAIGTAFYRDTPYDAIIRLLSLSPKFDLDGRFYAYWIGNVMLFFTDSAAIGQLSAIQMASYKTVYCSKIEQSMIADFLDKKCAAIDEAVDKTRASIEEYKKLKQSLITQAVTKGLRPHRPMKPSGIEWIGDIPEEWEVKNPKALFSQRKEKAYTGERQLTASQRYGVIYQDDYIERTGSKVVTVEKDFDILKHVEAGDFVISMRSFQRGLEYSTNTGSISSAYVMLIPNLCSVFSRYYKWLLKSSVYIDALQSTTNMVRDGQAMRFSNFVQIKLPVPPLVEQQEIADYLDKKCVEIDALITKKEALAKELEACKKSLIYEYVTGKTYCK